MPRLAQVLEQLPERLRHSFTRRILWLESSEASSEADLRSLLNQLNHPPQTQCLISERSLLGMEPVRRGEFVRHLGATYDSVILDVFSGLNPNTLAQAAGTLKGGGVLILLTPVARDWPSFSDPEYAHLGAGDNPKGHFIHWLVAHLKAAEAVVRVSDPQLSDTGIVAYQPRRNGVYLGSEQQAAVYALLRGWRNKRSCTLLDADRGRGKSSALGLSLGLQSSFTRESIVVTAVDKRALVSLQQAFSMLRPDSDPPKYLTPAQLLESDCKPQCLIIDEAASLPLPVLQQLTELAPHLVLSSTQHGYEGFSRGYGLRFIRELEQRKSDVQRLVLSQPLRWADGDPLEAWIDRVLLLNQEVALASLEEGVQEISRETLLEHPGLLEAVYQLLSEAHYRTSPSDLRILLDSAGQRLFVDVDKGVLAAVAWVAEEGPVDAELAKLIAQGRRRPAGNLLPQSLIHYQGWLQAAAQRFWRVARIAVPLSERRQGIARRLLRYVEAQAESEGADFLGASFAAHEDLLLFWQHLGFQLMRIGEAVDPVAAAPAAQVLLPLSARAESWIGLYSGYLGYLESDSGTGEDPYSTLEIELRDALALENFAHHFAPLKLVEGQLLQRYGNRDLHLISALARGETLSTAEVKQLRKWVAERLAERIN